jgi:hypothetical protein
VGVTDVITSVAGAVAKRRCSSEDLRWDTGFGRVGEKSELGARSRRWLFFPLGKAAERTSSTDIKARESWFTVWWRERVAP